MNLLRYIFLQESYIPRKMKMPPLIVSSQEYTKHLTGPWHPECPDRYSAIDKALLAAGLKKESNSLQPRYASPEEVLLCHTQEYLDLLEHDAAEAASRNQIDGSYTLSCGDVQMCPESSPIAYLAVGAGLTAVDAIMEGKGDRAFCLVRPPGHHACSDRGMGFCLFNNVAIAARYAQEKYGMTKVLIVDWDVHHGNGTQEIFFEDPNVFYFSTHRENFYPGTGLHSEKGIGKGAGTTLNFPIVPNENARIEVLEAFDKPLSNEMESFKPDLVLISAGFDAHYEDPLGGFNLNEEDYVNLTEKVVAIAEKYAQSRLVSFLEGGYNLEALGRSVVAHLSKM